MILIGIILAMAGLGFIGVSFYEVAEHFGLVAQFWKYLIGACLLMVATSLLKN